MASPWLRHWVDVIADHGCGRVVVVPGGGPFADAVRAAQARWGCNDAAAHRMALLAMEQHAYLLCSWRRPLTPATGIAGIRRALGDSQVPVWLASTEVLADREIPASWEVTSDSLALWLAARLGADAMLLVKSASLRTRAEPGALAADGQVDPWFPQAAAMYRGRIGWLRHEQFAALAAGLATGLPPGTEIGPNSRAPKKMQTIQWSASE